MDKAEYNRLLQRVCTEVSEGGGRVSTVIDAPEEPAGNGARLLVGHGQYEVRKDGTVRCDDCLEVLQPRDVARHACAEWWKDDNDGA